MASTAQLQGHTVVTALQSTQGPAPGGNTAPPLRRKLAEDTVWQGPSEGAESSSEAALPGVGTASADPSATQPPSSAQTKRSAAELEPGDVRQEAGGAQSPPEDDSGWHVHVNRHRKPSGGRTPPQHSGDQGPPPQRQGGDGSVAQAQGGVAASGRLAPTGTADEATEGTGAAVEQPQWAQQGRPPMTTQWDEQGRPPITTPFWMPAWNNSVAVCATMKRENFTDVREWLYYYPCLLYTSPSPRD